MDFKHLLKTIGAWLGMVVVVLSTFVAGTICLAQGNVSATIVGILSIVSAVFIAYVVITKFSNSDGLRK